jgi:hypothetical protein
VASNARQGGERIVDPDDAVSPLESNHPDQEKETVTRMGCWTALVVALAEISAVTAARSNDGHEPAPKLTTTALRASDAKDRTASAVEWRVARLDAIRRRGTPLTVRMRRETESRLERAVERLEVLARHDEGHLVRRLALEFGVTPDAWRAERTTLGASWTDLVIAHTLAANAPDGVEAADLFRLYDQGLGWSGVAYGMGLDLQRMTAAVKTECRVAAGRETADGRVERIPTASDRELEARDASAGEDGMRITPVRNNGGAH